LIKLPELEPHNSATALAHPNIAFIKYWGNRDPRLRIPSTGSISMNLDGLTTRITVTFDRSLERDVLVLDGDEVQGPPMERVSRFLDVVREMAGVNLQARVQSQSNFPAGSGIASSAAAFAALALAGSHAAGLELSERELSRLARRGSGSACRSVPGGFVEWRAGEDDASSYAHSIAPPDHWDIVDCIALVSRMHKSTGSTEGHALADSSPLQAARIAGADRRLAVCRRAILERDFQAFREVVELDSTMMHAVMMTSRQPLVYWLPATVAVIHAVIAMRGAGVDACYTIDAGPNVHVLCPDSFAAAVTDRLREVEGVEEVLTARPGGPARLVEE
jgi:diphosphomevalonate decarboxylase